MVDRRPARHYGKRYGETYEAVREATGYKIGHLKNLKWVAASMRPEVRPDDLPWRAHRAVAEPNEDEQRWWLDRAAEGGWTSDELRQELAARLPIGANAGLDVEAHLGESGHT